MTIKPINECKTVAELLEDPGRWTQGMYARDSGGAACNVPSENATCFCLDGAIQRVYEISSSRINARSRLYAELGQHSITSFNDSKDRTHAEVLEAVRKAGI